MPFRRFLPHSGSPYELFDAALFLLIIGSIGYLLTEPPPSQAQDALTFVYQFAPAQFWGAGLTASALAGIVCSYRLHWVRRGLLLIEVVCFFWAGCFAVGGLLYALVPTTFSGDFPWAHLHWHADLSLIRVVISVALYGWIGLRMDRELSRWDAARDLYQQIRGLKR